MWFRAGCVRLTDEPSGSLTLTASLSSSEDPEKVIEAMKNVLGECRFELTREPHQVLVDETPQHVYAEQILARLEGAPRLGFADLFDPPHHRARLVGLFLALLELVKGRQDAGRSRLLVQGNSPVFPIR